MLFNLLVMSTDDLSRKLLILHMVFLAHFFIRYSGTAFQSGNPSGILILVTVGRR